jgi:formylglycine-generating enzyme required for sulfatase activity
MKIRFRSTLAGLLALGALAGCGDSAKSRSQGIEQLDAIEKRWEDGLKVAESTSRIALSGPVMNLQSIRRDLDSLQASECMLQARDELGRAMDSSIQQMLLFMSSGDDDAAGALGRGMVVLYEFQMEIYRERRRLCTLSEREANAVLAEREAERKADEDRQAHEAAEAAARQAAKTAELLANCPSAKSTRKAGSSFHDPLPGGAAGPEMVVVSRGAFEMGSEGGDESPRHTVVICQPFALGKTEVTFEDYDRFAAATARSKPADQNWGRGTRPVINISWDDAVAYAEWLSQQTGKRYRLPSEAEWEYAARAGTTTDYPWGDTASHEHANYGTDECCDGLASGRDAWVNTAPVGSFPANAFGLHDMHGNVWEWVQDCYHENYEGAPADGSAREQCGTEYRVLRGGSWIYFPAGLRSAFRVGRPATDAIINIGFRLAQDLE